MKHSAGILLYKKTDGNLEVMLGHYGGPFYKNKDDGHWTVLKGEYVPDKEDPKEVAYREFKEETGFDPPDSEPIELGTVIQKNKKEVRVWGLEGDLDPSKQVSNTFRVIWPPGSGFLKEFPEIDRVAWYDIETSMKKIRPDQAPLIDRLFEKVGEE